MKSLLTRMGREASKGIKIAVAVFFIGQTLFGLFSGDKEL